MDFEAAIWAAAREVMPRITIRGCAFHWIQAVLRKVQSIGLQGSYTNDVATHKIIRKILALPPSQGEPDGENPSPSTRRRKAFTIPAKEIQTGTGEDIQPMGEIRRWTRYICLSSPESLWCHLLHQNHRIT